MRFSGPAPSPASFPPGLASLISCWCLRFRLCGVVSALSLIQGERVGLSTRGSGALPSRLGQQRRGRNGRKGCREAVWSPSLSASPQATWGQGGLWSLAFVPSKRSRAMTQQVESNHKKQPHSPWLPSGGEPSPPTPVPGANFSALIKASGFWKAAVLTPVPPALHSVRILWPRLFAVNLEAGAQGVWGEIGERTPGLDDCSLATWPGKVSDSLSLCASVSSQKWDHLNAGEGVKQPSYSRQCSYATGGNVNWCSHYEEQYGSSSENKK